MAEKMKALREGPSYRFAVNDMPKCPHCGADFDIPSNEAWFLYDENNTHEVTCPSCENDFSVSSMARWSFSTDEQDDIDEATHDR